MTIEQYKQAIKDATTQKELDDIRFKAFSQDTSGLFDMFDITFSFCVKPETVYERVCRLVHKREYELGFSDDDAYIKNE